MLPSYKDVIERAGPPDLWDEVGCPRYGDFSPDACRVYNDVCGLFLIGCQFCARTFRVAMGYDPTIHALGLRPKLEFPDPSRGYAGFHYGDPPRHADCSGDTANCEELEVLEFWVKSWRGRSSLLAWKRLRRCEGGIRDNYFDKKGNQRDFTKEGASPMDRKATGG